MKVPDDIPELEDRPQDERERLWAQAEKASKSRIRRGLWTFPVLLAAMEKPSEISFASRSMTFWIYLFGGMILIVVLDRLLLRRIHIRNVRKHLPDAIANPASPGEGVLSPLVKVQYGREAGIDPGEKAEWISKG